jgi:hypothetical protein
MGQVYNIRTVQLYNMRSERRRAQVFQVFAQGWLPTAGFKAWATWTSLAA